MGLELAGKCRGWRSKRRVGFLQTSVEYFSSLTSEHHDVAKGRPGDWLFREWDRILSVSRSFRLALRLSEKLGKQRGRVIIVN